MSNSLFVPEYASATRAADFSWWCARNLVQSIDRFDGMPLVLEPWQERFFSEALSLDESDLPYWRLVVLLLPRKNGKTVALSSYALYHALEAVGSPEILLAASSDKQAGRLFDAAVSFVRRNPMLDERLHLREYIGEIVRADGAGKIIRMASDPGRAHGYNPSLVVADELHAWLTPSLRKAWEAFTTGGGAREARQIFAITVAGEAKERESSILGQLLDLNQQRGELERVSKGLIVSRNHDARTLVYNYEAPTSDRYDVAALKLANPASWITLEYLDEQAQSPALSDGALLQLHGCVWAEGVGAWITHDRWANCESEEEIPDGADVCAAVDAAHTRDTTACTWTWRSTETGRLVQRTKVWSCMAEKPHHEFVPGGRLDNDIVRDFVRDVLAKRYTVRLVLFDERYFSDQAAELAEDDLVVAEMTQSKPEMRTAWSEFYDAINLGEVELAHDGDPVYAAHVRNAVARKRDDGSWHVSKAAHERVIDAVAAGAMSLYGAKHLDDFMPRKPARLVSW